MKQETLYEKIKKRTEGTERDWDVNYHISRDICPFSNQASLCQISVDIKRDPLIKCEGRFYQTCGVWMKNR